MTAVPAGSSCHTLGDRIQRRKGTAAVRNPGRVTFTGERQAAENVITVIGLRPRLTEFR
ncbi:hypothetical protein ACFXJ5_03830 [Streptomyces sp. NPDC059373]